LIVNVLDNSSVNAPEASAAALPANSDSVLLLEYSKKKNINPKTPRNQKHSAVILFPKQFVSKKIFLNTTKASNVFKQI